MTAPPMAQLTQPLIKSGARYTVEVARCIVFGVVLSGLVGVAFFHFATEGAKVHRGIVVLMSVLVFPVLYALAGHQRGIGRALATLTRSHGGFLYDHTLGRFVETTEARRPGAFAATAASPARLVQGFRVFLHESPKMPRVIRRVAIHYVNRVGQRVQDGGVLPPQVLADGQFNAAAFKHWAVDRMHDQFMPSWRGFGIVAGLQVACTAALLWTSR